MDKELVIAISPSGKVEAMHQDGFDLAFLGDRSIRRQTEIKFNLESQRWDITYLDAEEGQHLHPSLSGFAGYDEARGYEVRWINQCRLDGIDPMSDRGLFLMQSMRHLEVAGG